MKNMKQNIVMVILVILVLIGYGRYAIGKIDDIGGNIRLEYYETVFNYRERMEEVISQKQIIEAEEYGEMYFSMRTFTPLVDRYEEEVYDDLLQLYKIASKTVSVEGDIWDELKKLMKDLDIELSRAGFENELME